MGVREIMEQVDAQLKALAARKPVGKDRRQQQIAVTEERRSGQERRGIRRAFAELFSTDGCSGDCQQGRKSCTCRK